MERNSPGRTFSVASVRTRRQRTITFSSRHCVLWCFLGSWRASFMADEEKKVCLMIGKGKRGRDDYMLMILVESERDPGLGDG